MAAEMSRESRAMLLNVLWHHQGGSSPVGQPLRKLLGIGQFNYLTEEQVSEARWIDGLLSRAASGVPVAPAPAEPQWGPILDALDGWPNDCRDDDFKHLERLIRAEHARTLDRLDAARSLGVAAVPAAGPLRDLGAYLASVLDEDQWAHAERLLLTVNAGVKGPDHG
jgi:hypothetical protein